MADEHPVLSAIDAELERLKGALDYHGREVAQIECEIEALRQAAATVQGAVEGTSAAAKSSQAPQQRPLASSPPAPDPPAPASKRPREPGRRIPPRSEVLEFIRAQSGLTRHATIRSHFRLVDEELRPILKGLVAEGQLVRTGRTSATRYSLPAASGAPPPSSPPTSPSTNGAGTEGSLQGRILQACMLGPLTIAEMKAKLDVEEGELRNAVGALMRESELRIQQRNGSTAYAFVG
jgi:hypothetical protein